MSHLYYGDNLDVLRRHIGDETIDLIYLDPPFKSNQDYNVLFAEKDGTGAAAQFKAFEDTWGWNMQSLAMYQEIVEGGGRVSDVMQAFRKFLGTNDMLAYLTMMAPRLVELHRVLRPKGSIYLHCDPTASHYLKLLMDAVFGPVNFRNEIIWRRTGSHNSARRYGPIHDTILFYAKTRDHVWNRQYRPYLAGYVKSFFNKNDERGPYRSQTLTGSGRRAGESGKAWRSYDPTSKGRHWAFPGAIAEELELDPKISQHQKLEALADAGLLAPSEVDGLPEYRQYLAQSKGVQLQDIWTYQPYTDGALHGTDEAIDSDVKWLEKRGGEERLGYPTQKPEGLLERIIKSSSKEGDVVLDPFCGCGTAIAVAQRLNRNWIGIDITHLAINLIKNRLRHRFPDIPPKEMYEVTGEPVDLNGARQLAHDNDRMQFQSWALGLVYARPHEVRKGSDQGIDGRLYFHDEGATGRTKLIILSVKSGHVSVRDVRDLRGVIEREKAEIGVLLTLEDATKPMRTEATSAGFYKSRWGDHPKLQILTIAELLEGKGIDYPHMVNVTFKRAPRAQPAQAEQLSLTPVEAPKPKKPARRGRR